MNPPVVVNGSFFLHSRNYIVVVNTLYLGLDSDWVTLVINGYVILRRLNKYRNNYRNERH